MRYFAKGLLGLTALLALSGCYDGRDHHHRHSHDRSGYDHSAPPPGQSQRGW